MPIALHVPSFAVALLTAGWLGVRALLWVWLGLLITWHAPDLLNASGGSLFELLDNARARRATRVHRLNRYVLRVTGLGSRTGYVGRVVIHARVAAIAARRREVFPFLLASSELLLVVCSGPFARIAGRLVAGPPRYVTGLVDLFLYCHRDRQLPFGACVAVLFVGSGPFLTVRLWLYRRWLAWGKHREALLVWRQRRRILEAERPTYKDMSAAMEQAFTERGELHPPVVAAAPVDISALLSTTHQRHENIPIN